MDIVGYRLTVVPYQPIMHHNKPVLTSHILDECFTLFKLTIIVDLIFIKVLHHEEQFEFENKNPFLAEDEDTSSLASVAYR